MNNTLFSLFLFSSFFFNSFCQNADFVNNNIKTIKKNEHKLDEILWTYRFSKHLSYYEKQEKEIGPVKLGVRFDTGVLPYRKNKKWGFVNDSNEIVTKPILDSLFYGGLNLAYGFVKKKGYVLIDKYGKTQNKCTYKNADLIKFKDMLYIKLRNANDSILFAYYSKIDSSITITSNELETRNYYWEISKRKKEKELSEIEYFVIPEQRSHNKPKNTFEQLSTDYFILESKDSLQEGENRCFYLANLHKKEYSDCYPEYRLLSKYGTIVHFYNKKGDGVVINYNFDILYSYKNHIEFAHSLLDKDILIIKTLKKNGWFTGFYNLKTNQKVIPKYRFIYYFKESDAFFVITENFKQGYVRMDGTKLF